MDLSSGPVHIIEQFREKRMFGIFKGVAESLLHDFSNVIANISKAFIIWWFVIFQ